jgi:hypothetical protein
VGTRTGLGAMNRKSPCQELNSGSPARRLVTLMTDVSVWDWVSCKILNNLNGKYVGKHNKHNKKRTTY